jgi:hypothetical protein
MAAGVVLHCKKIFNQSIIVIMKPIKLTVTIGLSLLLLTANAQTETPKGYQKGSITLADGKILNGFVKGAMLKNASLFFLADAGARKKNYNASDLVAVTIDGAKYTSVHNDFFKIICEGEISYLQKVSDAKGSIVYNGVDPIVISGTDGKPGDYFFYQAAINQLKLVTQKNIAEVAAAVFKGNTEATAKAMQVKTDLLQLKEAVIAYNNR